MALATTSRYNNRQFFNLNTFFELIEFILLNLILIFIFLFLSLEEFDWAIFSSREQVTDLIIDETSWNIKTLI